MTVRPPLTAPLRVGLYIDAFNLYYGAREHCGRHTSGWRWLDVPRLVTDMMTLPGRWPNASLDRVVYCTADRNKDGDPTSLADQQDYIGALQAAYPGTIVERGVYAPREKRGDLLTGPGGTRVQSPGRAQIPGWLPASEVPGPSGGRVLRVTVTTFEEKGSDVNVVGHLLKDVLTGVVQAAVVVSNDSDLRFPIEEARRRVPVGTINPGTRHTARALRGQHTDGVGGHWWARLDPAMLKASQLPDPSGAFAKPTDW